ncbi:MAG: SNF2 helicase associated domain-containing protein [Muricoprocola sp.]
MKGEKMNTTWKNEFDQEVLEKGRTSCLKGKILNLTDTGNGYTASFQHVSRLFSVSSSKDKKSFTCNCPVSKSGKKCEHMAALLYSLDIQEDPTNKTLAALVKEETDFQQSQKAASEKKHKDRVEKIKQTSQKKVVEEKTPSIVKKVQSKAEKKRAEEEKAKLEAEKARLEAEKAQLEAKLLEEKEAKRKAREARKQAKSQREAERKQRVQEQLQQEAAKRLALEKKLEEKKKQAELEQKRLQEKRLLQEEMRKKADEKKAKEEMQKKADKSEKKELTEKTSKVVPQYVSLGGLQSNANDESQRTARPLENYRYFDADAIQNSLVISPKVLQQGRSLLNKQRVQLQSISTAYYESSPDLHGQASGTGENDRESFPIQLIFDRKRVLSFHCGCPACTGWYNNWYPKEVACPYKAGFLLQLTETLKTKNIGDATDFEAISFMNHYLDSTDGSQNSDEIQENSLHLVPRLQKKNGKLQVSFRVGSDKLFVIKNLGLFSHQVKNSEVASYGSGTKMNHDIRCFDESGKMWVHFITQIVQEEESFEQKIIDNMNNYRKGRLSTSGSQELFGWRLDQFYDNICGSGIEYEDKDHASSKKMTLTCAEGTAPIQIDISENKMKNEKEFHGIQVNCHMPPLYQGTSHGYFIQGEKLFKTSKAFLEKVGPLADQMVDGQFFFTVGRNHLTDFYRGVLPRLQEFATITETEPEKFRDYLPVDVQFVFYLDADSDYISCRTQVLYGNTDVSIFDLYLHRGVLPFRDLRKERKTLQTLLKWFPETDVTHEEFLVHDEDLMYQFMNEGVQQLMELGEVHATRTFMGYPVIKKIPLSVGVSVSRGNMLDLEIVTEDFSEKELLELLKSYRTKKKYYRMKNGAFVDLNNETLSALNDLTSALQIKENAIAKGSIQIPIYRSLYLEQLLKKNESIYSNRDNHFRKIIKDFKTVQESDFEEPESLSKIMRGYQKEGHKWMRMLDRWNFGGILADDMGLGKTLQVISVLLAEKQESTFGQSLIISPASLIYNWQEEFHRFAPELSVQVIAGNQNERQQWIQNSDADVLVTSYDLLKRDIVFYENKKFRFEVIDEAQYIKNHSTAAAKAVKIIKSQTRFALTGTPIENRLSELWSIFDYLMPGFLYSYETFRKELENPIVKDKDEEALARLQKMVSPFILRRLKEDVLKELPEKLEENRFVKMERDQRKLYDAQVLQLRNTLSGQDDEEFSQNKIQILSQITKLRQICCNPSLCFENYHGESAKQDACLDLIQSAMDGGHRILLFSQFTSMLDLLKTALDDRNIAWYEITGSTSKEKRIQLVKEFNEGTVPVFLISLKAGGVGLNLTGADVVIHYDPWWNVAAQNQATDRAHRIGQTKKVTVYKLIMKETIEEKIQQLQETKRDLAEQVIGGENTQLGSLNREELLELLSV